jgi:hypothetical protein
MGAAKSRAGEGMALPGGRTANLPVSLDEIVTPLVNLYRKTRNTIGKSPFWIDGKAGTWYISIDASGERQLE